MWLRCSPRFPKSRLCSVFFCFLNFFDCATQHVGSYLPNQELNPHPPALEVWSLSHWATREVPLLCFYLSSHCNLPSGYLLSTRRSARVICLSTPSPVVVATFTLPIWGASRGWGHWGSERFNSLTTALPGDSVLTEIGTQAGLAPELFCVTHSCWPSLYWADPSRPRDPEG